MTLLTACIAHVPTPERQRSLVQLVGLLDHPDVKVLIDTDEYPTLGDKRNAMREQAAGKYVVMIDDDDLVHPRYPQLVCRAIRDGFPDYIGYLVHVRGERKLTVHDLDNGGWWSDDTGWYRDIEQKNPIRRELAVQVPYPSVSFGEDEQWAQAMRRSKLVCSQVFIPEVMYHYQHDPARSLVRK